MFGKKNKKTTKKIRKKQNKKNGFFSTDVKNLSRKEYMSYVRDNAFQVIPEAPEKKMTIAKDGSEKIENVSFAEDRMGLKSAFTISNTLPETLFSWYVSQSFIGYQACAILNQHWLVNKACHVPAQDAARKGYEITINDGNKIDQKIVDRIRQLDKKYDVKSNLVELEQFRRVFGIRIAYFQIESNDKKYYEKPFNIDGIKKGSYKGIVQIDPYWITPELDMDASGNPASKYFYDPTYWRVNGTRIHRSHLVVVRYAEVPDVLKPTYVYGGLPLPQLIWERVYAAERTANEAPQLAMTKRTTGLYIDMEAAIANQESLEEKLSIWARFRDNFGIKTLGKDEKMEQFDTSLNDLDAVIMTQYQIVAGIANIPVTKLMGTTPKGFNSSGDYETNSYLESLESIQDDCYNKLLDRHYELLVKSEGWDFSIDVVWNSLKVLSEVDKATIRQSDATTALTYSQTGGIDGFDVRKKLSEDPESGFSGLEVSEDENISNSDSKDYNELINYIADE